MSLISEKRRDFHRQLLVRQVLAFAPAKDNSLVASIADTGQKSSKEIAARLLNKLADGIGFSFPTMKAKKKGQTLGNEFEELCAEFVSQTFLNLQILRPGHWQVLQVKSRSEAVLGGFEQYSHLAELARLAAENAEIKNFMGDGYTVSPDVIVARIPEPDEAINSSDMIVDSEFSSHTMLRAANHPNPKAPLPLLHASISCKFTMRSDRAQNTRTEALNLIRSRKGRTPHIISITAEPMPSRIASLALGTGDLDCVYHIALDELIETLEELERDDALDSIRSMVEGKRLKDISDLPLDLAI